MDVQKVQIHDLGASGFIPSLGSRYRWHWPKGLQLWGGECAATSLLLQQQQQQQKTTTTTTTNFIENWKITNYITFPPANSL